MSDANREKFKRYWEKTEIFREYARMLYTFGDTELPYVFLAQHPNFEDRTVVRKGLMSVKKPHILLPGSQQGPEFGEGFAEDEALPEDAAYLIRGLRLPYSKVTNRPAVKEEMEYGEVDQIAEQFDRRLEKARDRETGLLKGPAQAMEVSLMRYSLGLIIKSAPDNVEQFFEHLRRQRGNPIQPHEQITDEDIRRLFE
jgi:hypothetical protein